MRLFDQLLGLLSNIPDPRRAEGKLYKLHHVLLFSILTVVTGGSSYRSIVTFIKVHRRRLNAAFGLHWRRAPARTSIRYILQGLEPQGVEQIFRQHAAGLCGAITGPARRVIAIDGKTFRRSCDNFTDRKAAQVLHAFDVEAGLILAHVDIADKSNEIPPRSSCSANSRSRTASSRSMPCIAKNLRGRRTGAGSPHPRIKSGDPTEGQSALAAAESRNRPHFPAARQQRHLGLHQAQPTRNQVGRPIQRHPLRGRNRVDISRQISRPRHPRGPASRCQDRPVEHDAEVVGDLIAVDMPVPQRLLSQESQYRTSEILDRA
jgi:hypothetical protein